MPDAPAKGQEAPGTLGGVGRSEPAEVAIGPEAPVERVWLDEWSWVDGVRGFLAGHEVVAAPCP